MPLDRNQWDVLIVGSGIMGASAARLIRDARPAARILMLDAGPVLGTVPGQHLHDMPDGELRLAYNERISSGIQGLYAGADVSEDLGGVLAQIEPGMYRLATFGEESSAMPTAALAWNTGGMGVHWTAATPTPWGREALDFIDAGEWAADLASAQAVLKVNPDPFRDSKLRSALIGALNDVFAPVSHPGREVQPMPMAINPDGQGGLLRTGPNRIFPPMSAGGDEHFEIRPASPVVRILHDAGRAAGVVVRELGTGLEYVVNAAATLVCADVFRTPQLLFASDIRPPALGRYLNEHLFLTGRAAVDLGAVGIDAGELAAERSGEWLHATYWLPHSDESQPFNGQFSGTVRFGDDGSVVDALAGTSLYVPTEVRASNRVTFSDSEVDAVGLPRMSLVFDYTERDRRLLEDAQQAQQRAARRLGGSGAETESAVLPPGTSLHMTGTTRMGPVDDGTSVCDPDARVWGLNNLYLAGCGVVPTAVVGNSTLIGVVTAVRAARAIAATLGG